jgi:hypothetical protein
MDEIITPHVSESGALQQARSPAENPKGKPKLFNCPACGGALEIKAVGISIDAVCRYCSTVIDVTDENYRIISHANKKNRSTLIEMGARGRLQGIDWEVIGYMDKSDGSGEYHWDEYLLFNPYHGFRFLVQSAGHWSFVKVLRRDVPGAGFAQEVLLDGEEFRIFLKGHAFVRYVKGEFYWRVKVDERTEVADYISPPLMLSVESHDQEINISLGQYIAANEIKEAFKITSEMPAKTGVAPHQPSPYPKGYLWKIWKVAFIAIVCAVGIHILMAFMAENAHVYSTQGYIQPYQKGQTFSSAAFQLPEAGNVLIQSASPVQNDWVELGLSLVNEQTHEAYNFQHAIEYYSGYAGGESWHEGAQFDTTTLSRVPPGSYRLLIDAEWGAFQNGAPVTFSISVTRDVSSVSNILLTFWLLIVYPFFASIRMLFFETKRWSDSDFAHSNDAHGDEGNNNFDDD